MDAASLYSQTLSQLGATELAMTSPQGDALLQAAAPPDHKKGVQCLLDVHEARLALGNAALQSIADKLKANEQALVAGTTSLQAAVQALNNLTQILNTAGTLIAIVGQIVPLV